MGGGGVGDEELTDVFQGVPKLTEEAAPGPEVGGCARVHS